MGACAPQLKRLVLELGGKDPMIVFGDADLEKAAKDAVYFSLFNCGQVCCSVERIYVDASIKDAFEAKVRGQRGSPDYLPAPTAALFGILSVCGGL